ncbi:MAG: prephenate dehydrogenase/arogenate dehydrogenase family protein [Thermoleophilia bacterium]|nr:prephenate dehydrogenase/arogenate dehydrogenase family protein [Thermoleophilia bacterium]
MSAPGAPAAIIGIGLMGGSLGLALRARAGVPEVRGFDPDAAARAEAVKLGAVDVAAGSLEEAIDGASTVFLAAPVGQLAELAKQALSLTGETCVVTDVGSAKGVVMAALDRSERRRFIGGHPVCGAERSGVGAAREDLFEGATYFLTPSDETQPALFERLHHLVTSIGAHPVAIDPEAHDSLMAMVSHVPHVLASALINQAAGTAPEGREALRSAGPSFADLTRVGGANPPLWADILLANRSAVASALESFSGHLNAARVAVERGDREWLLRFFEQAGAGRGVLLASDRELEGERPWRLSVTVPDEPGVISAIATALGHAHINIEDLGLVPGPPDGVGELRLLVAGQQAAERAAELIREVGYGVRAEPVA